MSMQGEVTTAFMDLAAVFGKTASVQGVDNIPITTGPNVNLSTGYGDGGTNQLQTVNLHYASLNNPVPLGDGAVEFSRKSFRIQAIYQHQATWEIIAVHVNAQATV